MVPFIYPGKMAEVGKTQFISSFRYRGPLFLKFGWTFNIHFTVFDLKIGCGLSLPALNRHRFFLRQVLKSVIAGVLLLLARVNIYLGSR